MYGRRLKLTLVMHGSPSHGIAIKLYTLRLIRSVLSLLHLTQTHTRASVRAFTYEWTEACAPNQHRHSVDFFFFCLLDAAGPMCWLVPAAASAAGAVWRSNNMELTPTPTTVYSIIDTFGWLLNAYGGFGFGITLRSRVCLLKIFPVDICELWHCILACNMAPDLL